MTQRVLVTGAGGFVGQNIVQALVEAGHDVVALDRHFDDAVQLRWHTNTTGHIECVRTDISTIPDFNVDSVIHAAAITASPEEMRHTPEENYKANNDATLTVLAWAERQQVRRVVVLSSGAVYRATQPGPIDEMIPTTPLGLYAIAKDAAEKLVETLRSQYRRDIVAVRLSNIYGPYEHPRTSRPHISLVANLVHTALDQGYLTIYKQDDALDWTFAPDIGRAIERILTAPVLQHHLYHIASEHVLKPLDIAYEIKTGLPSIDLNICEGRNPESIPRSRLGYLSSKRLQTELGFDQWTSFTQGIQTVITWQQSEREQ